MAYWQKSIRGKAHFNYGRHHSETTKQKISLSKQGQGELQINLEPSENLSYILGVLAGDGYIYERTSHTNPKSLLGLNTKDEVFAQKFATSLSKIGFHPHLFSYTQMGLGEGTKMYGIRGYSKQFVKWYKEHNLIDLLYKTITTYNDKLQFLCGFYESEGSFIQSYPYGKGHKPYYRISFSNTNGMLLELSRKYLLQHGFRVTNISWSENNLPNSKQIGYFSLNGEQEVKKFIGEINPIIKRGGFVT